jgi:hypothetical protein
LVVFFQCILIETENFPLYYIDLDIVKASKSMQMHESRSQNPSFLDLVDDILHLICSELYATSRASLLALAQVSPSLNAIATPYIFRNLLISPGPEGTRTRKAYELLLQRLQEEAGSKLAKNVQHLRVDGFESTASLEAILGMCKNLREFRYSCFIPWLL